MDTFQIKRLGLNQRDLARMLFKTIAEVFAENHTYLSDRYLDELLGREEFWAIAAFAGDELIGGITAHALPMTTAESSDLFVYDIAVRADFQRQGVGRQLIIELCERAAEQGIMDICVPADTSDLHALRFYRALGGRESSVTYFTLDRDAL